MIPNRPNWEPPTEVATELGNATIGRVSSAGAHRTFLCPLCDTSIQIGESHVVAVPIIAPNLRRHIHTDCLDTYINQNLSIKLHPKVIDPFDLYILGLSEGT